MRSQEDRPEEPSFEELLKEYSAPPRADFRRGERVMATVVEITGDTVFVDFGGRGEGAVDAGELTDDDGNLTVDKGDTIELQVAQMGPEGVILTRGLKLKGAEAKEALQEAQAAGIPVEGTVTGVNPGGFDVDLGGVRAFCPVSQIDLNYVTEPQAMVGIKDNFRVIEYGEQGRRIVVSRRAILSELAESARRELEARLEPGVVLPGQVTRLEPFGAFVDLGGLEGLIHISELSRRRVGHPQEILSPGQEVEVAILRVETDDRNRLKVGLSLRALEPDPWEAGLDFAEGDVVTGTVRRLQPFGAFVEVAPGVDGLVHISEISFDRIRNPGQVLTEDQEVQVRVLSIDRGAHRISLSIKAALDRAGEEPGEAYIPPPPPDRPSLGSVLGDALRRSLEKGKE